MVSAPARVDTASLLARVDIVQVIGARIDLRKAGPEYEACCPFHTEKTPSFKVSPSKQIYHCFGCGANGDAIGFLRQYEGLTFVEACEALGGGLVPTGSAPVPAPASARGARTPWVPILPAPADAPEPPKAHIKRGFPQRIWTYRSAEGAVLGYVYRFVTSSGGKEILPVVWARNEDTGETEWHWLSFPKPRPLYGLDRLAAKPEATVLLTEGEKCADAGDAELPELASLSWPGGGKADGHVDWSPLIGRKVVLWADADAKRVPLTPAEREAGIRAEDKPLLPESEQPGIQTMARIRGRLLALGCRVWEVQLPPPGAKPDGWDIADAVMDGLRGSELAEFVRSRSRQVMPIQPAPAPAQDEPPPDFDIPMEGEVQPPTRGEKPLLIDASDWLAQSAPMQWVVDGLVQRGNLYAMTAVTNHGKTAIGLLMAMCIAAGRKFAGHEITQGKVMILCGENPDGFRTRMMATMEAMGLEPGDVAGLITVLPHALPLSGCVDQVLDEARRLGGDYALVLVDTSVSYYSGDNEDDNLQARTHAWHLRAMVELPGRPAVVANCHPPKSADRESLLPRGGGAFLNEIDTNLTVWADGEIAHLHWHRKKRGPDFDPLPFEFHGKTVEEHGMKVPAVVALPITEERARELRQQRRTDEDRLLYAMLHHPDETFAGWATACGWNGEKAKSKVSRIMSRLKEDNLVKRYRESYILTGAGEKEAQGIR